MPDRPPIEARLIAPIVSFGACAALAAGLTACGETASPTLSATPGVEGTWRAAIECPGGALPFLIAIGRGEKGLDAAILNGEESVTVPRVERDGDQLTLGFDHYDSEIRAAVAADGGRLEGEWTKVHHGGRVVRMPFHAVRAAPDSPRFDPTEATGSPAVGDVTGEWAVVFDEGTRLFPARGVFHPLDAAGRGAISGAPGEMMGTFVTPEGDYRYLAGEWRHGVLRLSGFDGAHAFLVVARAREDGSLGGDIWSRDAYHAPFTARRVTGVETAPPLPDPFAMTTLTRGDGRLSFGFPDLDGRVVASDDPRFAGRVLLVHIFGSWCPNCNDEAPLLADLYRSFHGRGLEIVGLAFEVTGDPARDAVFVRRFAERHAIPWLLLLAGTSDKAEASKVLPDLSGILSFPTLVFVGRHGRVRAIHTGFSGPGTGGRYDALRQAFIDRIEALLEEPAPGASRGPGQEPAES